MLLPGTYVNYIMTYDKLSSVDKLLTRMDNVAKELHRTNISTMMEILRFIYNSTSLITLNHISEILKLAYDSYFL